MQQVGSYILKQGIICAAINVALNPVVAWLVYRQLDFVPLWGRNSMVIDTAATSVVLSLLVTLFTTAGVHHAIHAGSIRATDGFPRKGRLLSYLPRQAWSLGLLLGIGIACVLTLLTFGFFQAVGFSGLPLSRFLLFKAMYTGPLGFAVTRWVILRQLLG